MSGFIYVMTNPAFPDLIKIGKSQKDPTTDRVNELNQTGVPEPFKVEYYAFVGDENKFELFLHKKFSAERPNPQREFFSVSVSDAVFSIRNNASNFGGMKYEETNFSKEFITNKLWSKDWWSKNPTIVEIKKEIETCEDINKFNDDGYTPLLLAINNLDSKEKLRDTTLWSKADKVDEIELLINSGADVNLATNKKNKDSPDLTPLQMITFRDFLGLHKLLLEKGANPNKKRYGETVFQQICSFRDLPFIELYLKYNVDINNKNKIGETPLHSLINYGYLEEKGGTPEEIKKLKQEKSKLKAIKLLVEKGADINAVDNKGFTLLQNPLKAGDLNPPGTVTLLCELGIDLSHVNYDGHGVNVLGVADQWKISYPNSNTIYCSPGALELYNFLGIKPNPYKPSKNPNDDNHNWNYEILDDYDEYMGRDR